MKKPVNMITTIFGVLIAVGAVLMLLSSIPVRNTIEDDMLITRFLLGNRNVVDIGGSEIQEAPEDSQGRLMRTNGTAIGRKRSGKFRNVKTGRKFIFQVTGKGTRYMVQKDDENYIFDLEDPVR